MTIILYRLRTHSAHTHLLARELPPLPLRKSLNGRNERTNRVMCLCGIIESALETYIQQLDVRPSKAQ